MVREIPAEPIAESTQRKEMVSSLLQNFNAKVGSRYLCLRYHLYYISEIYMCKAKQVQQKM